MTSPAPSRIGRLTLSLNIATLVILLAGTAVIAPRLMKIQTTVETATSSTSEDAAIQATVNEALSNCSGALDDHPVKVPIGQTVVGRDGTVLTCTQNRVLRIEHR